MSNSNRGEPSAGIWAAIIIFVLIVLGIPKPWGAITFIIGLLVAGSFCYVISGHEEERGRRIAKAIVWSIVLFFICGGWGLFFMNV